MAEVESVLNEVLLSLQFCLAFWQIVKLTAFGCFIKAFISCCFSKLLPGRLGTLLSPSYSRLKQFDSHFFFVKDGFCFEIKGGDQPSVASQVSGETVIEIKEGDQPSVASQVSDETVIFEIEYLGQKFHIERRERYKLFVKGKMAYYITDPIWQSLLNLKTIDRQIVFLKGHKVLFGAVITGGVMELSEVLDSLILRNEIIKPVFEGTSRFFFLPINLSVSEEKLLKGLNLVGLFLQTKKQMYWLIPTLLSLTSAVMEFCTALRVLIFTNVNRIFCWAMRPLCDHLPVGARVCIYTLLEWVENCKPSNDFEWRVVRDVKHVVIGGVAKAYSQTASLVQPTSEVKIPCLHEFTTEAEYRLRVKLSFDAAARTVDIAVCFKTRYLDPFKVGCDEDEYKGLYTFIDCLMTSRSGSLESCEPNGRVCRVRSLQESISCYIKNGFPDVYRLELENAIIK